MTRFNPPRGARRALALALSLSCVAACHVDAEWSDHIGDSAHAVTYSDFRAALAPLTSTTIWPISGPIDPAVVRSVFGPRLKTGGIQDFHRGIDIPAAVGTPAIAVLDGGLVDRVGTLSGLGNYAMVKYPLPAPTDFHGVTATHFWVVYGHLDRVLVPQGTSVDAGDVIAETGQTGSATYPHLHLELRLGKRCSMEYQLTTTGPVSDCRPPVGMEFDPHIDPMMLYPRPPPGLRVLTCPPSVTIDGVTDTIVEWDSGTREDIILNRAEVSVRNAVDKPLGWHELDHNLRTGYDASSTAALDNWDTTVPYFDPIAYGASPSSFRSRLVIPGSWLGQWPHASLVYLRLGDDWYHLSDPDTYEQCGINAVP